MPDIQPLHNAVAAAALAAGSVPQQPVVGVSVGNWADKATWGITFDLAATAAQKSAAQTALQAFDPAGAAATSQATFDAAFAAGLTLTWTISTALNDVYPIDTATQVRMLAERVQVLINGTFTNGTTTLTWFGITGTSHTMTLAQAGLFIKAVWAYLSALFVARAVAASGGTPSWPLSSVTITG
jgi:hypothetical protein